MILRSKIKKNKKYLIIRTAGCNKCHTSNTIARLKGTRWIYGPKCPCGNQLGPMEWSVLGEAYGIHQYNALRNWWNRNTVKEEDK